METLRDLTTKNASIIDKKKVYLHDKLISSVKEKLLKEREELIKKISINLSAIKKDECKEHNKSSYLSENLPDKIRIFNNNNEIRKRNNTHLIKATMDSAVERFEKLLSDVGTTKEEYNRYSNELVELDKKILTLELDSKRHNMKSVQKYICAQMMLNVLGLTHILRRKKGKKREIKLK